MVVTPAAAIFLAGAFSPVPRRRTNPIFPAAGKVRPRLAVSVDEAPTTVTPPSTAEQQGKREEGERIAKEWLRDYYEQAAEMGSDGGPPRWFSPLECAPAPPSGGRPLLLYLPGADGVGVGVGLVMHHQKLAKMFDVWCLHIPPMDRTPFTELVKLVEETVRSQNSGSPNSPVYLVGESLGGCLALAIAARNPDVDLVLVLANPATSFNRSQLQQTVGELSQGLAAISSYRPVMDRALTKEALLWRREMIKEASAYANSHLHAVKAQTLILSSGRDQESERLHRTLPKCELRQFNNSGHFLFLDGDVDLVNVIKGASFYRRSKHFDYITDYVPPTPFEIQKIRGSYRLLYLAAGPVMLSTLETGKVVKGLAGIPTEGPVLFVGYHSLLGMELIPFMLEFLIQRNILVRGLAHPMMFTKVKDGFMPISATSLFNLLASQVFPTLRALGVVPVTGTNLFKLLSSKNHVLLYPGGIREAFHRKGEKYKLFWPENSEFVRMAARFGAKIVPFGIVGEDDFGEVVFDYDDMMKIPYLKKQLEELEEVYTPLRTDATGELAKQPVHIPGVLPKPPGGRLYIHFGKPIETQGRKKEKSTDCDLR